MTSYPFAHKLDVVANWFCAGTPIKRISLCVPWSHKLKTRNESLSAHEMLQSCDQSESKFSSKTGSFKYTSGPCCIKPSQACDAT